MVRLVPPRMIDDVQAQGRAPRQRRDHQSAAEGDHEDDHVEAHFSRPLCRSVDEIVCNVCVNGDAVMPSVGEYARVNGDCVR